MVDSEGVGSTISVPTVLISKKDGDALIEIMGKLNNTPKDSKLINPLILKMEFEVIKTEIVDYKFYLNIPHPEAEVFLHNFNKLRPFYL